jgi:hypothetical protein
LPARSRHHGEFYEPAAKLKSGFRAAANAKKPGEPTSHNRTQLANLCPFLEFIELACFGDDFGEAAGEAGEAGS